jgi:hypothetical protein
VQAEEIGVSTVEIETFEENGYNVTIETFEGLDSPRVTCDNLGVMVCFHQKYNMPHEAEYYPSSNTQGHWVPISHLFRSWDRLEEEIYRNEGPAVVLPVYILDHSGVVYRAVDGPDPFRYFYMGMDSCQVGFIYITRQTVRDEFGWKRVTAKRRAQLIEYLQAEVETYQYWANGEVYAYIIEKDGEEIDSCVGYYGMEAVEEAAREACHVGH